MVRSGMARQTGGNVLVVNPKLSLGSPSSEVWAAASLTQKLTPPTLTKLDAPVAGLFLHTPDGPTQIPTRQQKCQESLQEGSPSGDLRTQPVTPEAQPVSPPPAPEKDLPAPEMSPLTEPSPSPAWCGPQASGQLSVGQRPRRTGERKHKSVRGCTVHANLSVLNLVIVKKGEKDIPGLTDTTVPRHLGPKRADRIRKLFNLSKDDVHQYVVKSP
ncbi:hypothetical protein MG293_000128 [Ovis ammon polii]|uniref:Small ribosomal subunit protein eS6 n=1 Tax=Ovis ammon polii TaxID=230172 RepID=A0AAD4YH66_OVIAM|nr:hypothetical protein MG293_000128 [Ovis ammon polii]